MAESTTQDMLAKYFEEQAEWRRQNDDGDPRNARSARGLLDAADYVRELPDEDARLFRVGIANIGEYGINLDELRHCEGADEIARSFRYSDPLDTPDALLTRFAAKFEVEAFEAYEAELSPPQVAEYLSSQLPTLTLLAVRYFAKRLDQWEDIGVLLARDSGWTWDQIAALLGRSRQGVWAKHHEQSDAALEGGNARG